MRSTCQTKSALKKLNRENAEAINYKVRLKGGSETDDGKYTYERDLTDQGGGTCQCKFR